jgi:hypothetical protein
MPAGAAGRSVWTAEERAHIDGCDACRAEWQLVQGASQLGSGVALGHDPDALTRDVLARVRAADAADQRRRFAARAAGLVGLAVAAGMALTLIVRQPASRGGGVAPSAVFELPLAELDGAEPQELEQVLAEFEAPLSERPAVGMGIDELDATQVEHALRAWEES